jgi:WD40 repeat protein
VWVVEGDIPVQVMTLSADGGTSGVDGVAFEPNGARVFSNAGGTVLIWDVGMSGQEEWASLPLTPTEFVHGVRFLPDGSLAVSVERGVILWDPSTGETRPIGPQDGTVSGYYRSDVSPADGAIARVENRPPGERTLVSVWDPSTGDRRFVVRDASSPRWSPDGSFLVVLGGPDIRIVDPNDGRVLERLRTPGFAGWSIDVSADGELIAISGSEGEGEDAPLSIHVIDRSSGQTVIIPAYADWVSFDPRGGQVVGAAGDVPQVWDVDTGARVGSFPTWMSEYAVTFSNDGGTIAAVAGDGSARLVDATTFDPLSSLPPVGDPASPASGCQAMDSAFSPDGSILAVQTCDGVRLWALDVDDLLAIARENVTRTLAVEECQLYLRQETCPAL